MDFHSYEIQMRLKGSQWSLSEEQVSRLIIYANHLNEQNLPVIYDQQHLALLIGVKYNYLLSVSNSTRKFYKRYEIDKRNGGKRIIMEPLPTLKEIQEWILKRILYPIAEKNVAKTAKAYIPGKGLKDNVRFHRRKKLVMKIDLKDFFGHIRYSSVMNIFKCLGYNTAVAVMLAKLCTIDGSLPQGAPTSPMLSNLAFREIDDLIFSYCEKHRIMYSRYSDDMTFSGDFDPDKLYTFAKSTIEERAFRINSDKSKVTPQHQRQMVTNVVVNEKIQLSRSARRKIRQEMYYIKKFGFNSHLQYISKTNVYHDYYRQNLYGRISYALYVNPSDKEIAEYRRYLSNLVSDNNR